MVALKKFTVKKAYAIDGMSYDILTNAEMVRLYHMFM